MVTASRARIGWFAAAALLVLCADTIVFRIAAAAPVEERLLIVAIFTDVLLTIPLLYYFLVVRPRGGKWRQVLPVVAAGLAASWFILPASQRAAIWIAEALLLPLELAFIGYEVRLLVRVIRAYREARRQEADPAEALRMTIRDKMGAGVMTSLVMHDLLMYYYVFFSWRRQASAAPGNVRTFAYDKGSVTMTAVYAALILLDGIALHILLSLWSHAAAWIVTASHIWLLLLLIADCRASSLQRITLEADRIRIRYGLKLQADIPLSRIASAHAAMEFRLDKEERRTAAEASVSMQPPNVRIVLHDTCAVETMLFLPRQADRLYLVVDEPERLVSALNGAIAARENERP